MATKTTMHSSPYLPIKCKSLNNPDPLETWRHIRDPKLHRCRTLPNHHSTQNSSGQSDEHGSDSQSSGGGSGGKFSANIQDENSLEHSNLSCASTVLKQPNQIQKNQNEVPKINENYYENNETVEISHANQSRETNQSEKSSNTNANTADLRETRAPIGRDLMSPTAVAEKSLILRRDTLWQNEHGELYRLLCPKNDLQGNELRSAKRKIAQEVSTDNNLDDDYLSDTNHDGWKSDSELVLRERKVTFSEKPPEVNRIPAHSSSPPDELVAEEIPVAEKKRSRSIKRKLQKITRDLENSLKTSREV